MYYSYNTHQTNPGHRIETELERIFQELKQRNESAPEPSEYLQLAQEFCLEALSRVGSIDDLVGRILAKAHKLTNAQAREE